MGGKKRSAVVPAPPESNLPSTVPPEQRKLIREEIRLRWQARYMRNRVEELGDHVFQSARTVELRETLEEAAKISEKLAERLNALTRSYPEKNDHSITVQAPAFVSPSEQIRSAWQRGRAEAERIGRVGEAMLHDQGGELSSCYLSPYARQEVEKARRRALKAEKQQRVAERRADRAEQTKDQILGLNQAQGAQITKLQEELDALRETMNELAPAAVPTHQERVAEAYAQSDYRARWQLLNEAHGRLQEAYRALAEERDRLKSILDPNEPAVRMDHMPPAPSAPHAQLRVWAHLSPLARTMLKAERAEGDELRRRNAELERALDAGLKHVCTDSGEELLIAIADELSPGRQDRDLLLLARGLRDALVPRHGESTLDAARRVMDEQRKMRRQLEEIRKAANPDA